MDKIDKALLKLSSKQRAALLLGVEKILQDRVEGLDIKKLKGHTDTYRLRIGNTRLIYKLSGNSEVTIVAIGKRDDQTYRDF